MYSLCLLKKPTGIPSLRNLLPHVIFPLKTDIRVLIIFHEGIRLAIDNCLVILLHSIFSYPSFKNRFHYILPFPGYMEKG